jgi:hypothetical protein
VKFKPRGNFRTRISQVSLCIKHQSKGPANSPTCGVEQLCDRVPRFRKTEIILFCCDWKNWKNISLNSYEIATAATPY